MKNLCPDTVALGGFAVGNVPGAAGETLARHVEGCPACQSRLEALDLSNDDLVGQLQHLERSEAVASPNDGCWAQAAVSALKFGSKNCGGQVAADAGRGLALRRLLVTTPPACS